MMKTTEAKRKTTPFDEAVTQFAGITLHEFMPPIVDEEAGTITFYCSKCLKVKTISNDTPLTYSVKTALGNAAVGWSGWLCPKCEHALNCHE